MEHAGEFVHGYTYSGHPLACAAGLVNLRIMQEEDLPGRVGAETGPHLARAWATLGDHPLVGEARTRGMLGALELVADKTTGARFDKDVSPGTRCRDLAVNGGLVMRAVGDTMIISPPLIITTDEIDDLVVRARTALDTLADELSSEGHSLP
jgi:putrescine aminotransferase